MQLREILFPKLETVCFVKRSEALSVDLKVVQRLRQKNVSVFSVDSDSENDRKTLTLSMKIKPSVNDMTMLHLAAIIALLSWHF